MRTSPTYSVTKFSFEEMCSTTSALQNAIHVSRRFGDPEKLELVYGSENACALKTRIQSSIIVRDASHETLQEHQPGKR